MGFLLRIGFWLAVAIAIMPKDQRPGVESAGLEGAQSLEDALRMTAYSAYNLVVQFQQSCETNPDLCKATEQLANTALSTGRALVSELQDGVLEAKPVQTGDGRVGKFQNRVE